MILLVKSMATRPRTNQIMRTRSMMITSQLSQNFYYKLGSPKFISAPMVDQSSIAWRTLVRKYDVGLAYTPMINAKIFARSEKVRKGFIDWIDEDGKPYQEDIPLIAQLAGDNIQNLIESGKRLQGSVTAIDLNLGCPQNIAKKGHYGAHLLQESKLVLEILSAMVKTLDCPVTVKIRRLQSDQATVQLCRDIEACGVQLITIHGRTLQQCKLFTGPADWEIIRQVKDAVSIPVIANGGIADREEAIRCLQHTGVDGIMSSEALLENPKLFSIAGDHAFKYDNICTQFTTAKELIDHFHTYNQDYDNFHQLRGHLFKILHRFLDAPANVDVRNELAECRLDEIEQVVISFEKRFADVDYQDNDEMLTNGLVSFSSWYYRHRDDKAQLRIYSPKKDKLSGPVIETPATIEAKLESLRQRLQQRKHRVG